MEQTNQEVEKNFKVLEWWMIMIGLLVADGFFVHDVWIKYQAKDTSIKISAKDLQLQFGVSYIIDEFL